MRPSGGGIYRRRGQVLRLYHRGGSFMTWSFPIVSVKGTVIRIHMTFVLFLLWIGGAHYAHGGAGAALQGGGFILLVFACVVLPDLAQALAARRYCVETPDIPLLP